jgi:Ion transport protein.
MLVVLFDILFTPFEVSFYQEERRTTFLKMIFPILETVFIVDILINFRMAYYDKGMLVTNGRQIVHYYLRKGFSLDFLAVLAELIAVVSYGTSLWYLKIIKIVRVKKLFFMTNRIEDFLNLQRSVSATLKLIKLWGTILIVGHWIACLFHILAYNRKDTEMTWLDKANLENGSIFERYIAAFYWAVMTMTTVGYGDIGPTTAVERLFTIAAMIIACALFGYSMNTIGVIFQEINSEKQQAKEKIRSVKNYMNQKNLGRNIQTRVKNYLQYMIDSKNFHKHEEEEFFKMLSQALKDEIISEVNGKILVECKIFSTNFSYKSSMHLSRFMYEKFLSPEEVLFEVIKF